jgi:uncharacterized iron-regulated membrane protein
MESSVFHQGMDRAVRLIGITLALLGWMVATGLAWDGLQLAAWANMARVNAQTMSSESAIQKAITGAPCKHCLAVREARKDSEKSSPTNSTTQKPVGDLALLQEFIFLTKPTDKTIFQVIRSNAVCVWFKVPVPPPKRLTS